MVLVVRLWLGLVSALRATLVYGEVGTLTTEPLPVPGWIDRLLGLDPLAPSARQPA